MNDAKTYLQALIASVTVEVIIPLAILLLLLLVVWWILRKVPNIDECLQDEAGKISSVRVIAVIAMLAFAISAWGFASLVLSGKLTSDEFLYFLLAWASSAILGKFADAWNGILPWAKEQPVSAVTVTRKEADHDGSVHRKGVR